MTIDEEVVATREECLERTLRDIRVVMARACDSPPNAPPEALLACLMHMVTEALGDEDDVPGDDVGEAFGRFVDSVKRLLVQGGDEAVSEMVAPIIGGAAL